MRRNSSAERVFMVNLVRAVQTTVINRCDSVNIFSEVNAVQLRHCAIRLPKLINETTQIAKNIDQTANIRVSDIIRA